DAAQNALNKIADKLLDMALNKLFENAFGGSKGGGGGFLGSIINAITGGGSKIGGTVGQPGAAGFDAFLTSSASGNVFKGGDVIPFARGGIVDRPIIFPMARGAGL